MTNHEAIVGYSKSNGYIATELTDKKCTCGSNQFKLFSDDEEGGAFVICSSCTTEQDIENSKEYIEEPYQNITLKGFTMSSSSRQKY